jgi:hypothetical protein
VLISTTFSERQRTKANNGLAEGVGFEPTIRFPVYTLSKRAPSATRPSLRKRDLAISWLGFDLQLRRFSSGLTGELRLSGEVAAKPAWNLPASQPLFPQP